MHNPTETLSIPPAVLARVQHALTTLHAWNAALAQARRMEQVAQQPGRYEYDLRHGMDLSAVTMRLNTASALDLLVQFEAMAQTNHVDPDAVYASLGGKPALLAEGAHVQQWRKSQ